DGTVTAGPIDPGGGNSTDDTVEDQTPNYFPLNTADTDGDGNEDWRNGPAVGDIALYPYVLLTSDPEIWGEAETAKNKLASGEAVETFDLGLEYPTWPGDLCLYAYVQKGGSYELIESDLFQLFDYDHRQIKAYIFPRANNIGL